jgi:hypothetical protein
MVRPPVDVDGEPSKFTVWPGTGFVGENVKLAIAPPTTTTELDARAV